MIFTYLKDTLPNADGNIILILKIVYSDAYEVWCAYV